VASTISNIRRTVSRALIGRSTQGVPPVIAVAIAWVAMVILLAVLADVLAPHDFTEVDLRKRLIPPYVLGGGHAEHILGTDHLGRDIVSRLLFGIRISLLIALIGTLIGAVLGTLLGFAAAHFRGWVDNTIMLLVDFQASLPFMLLALAILAFYTYNLPLFLALMGIYGWEKYARIARGMALSAQEQGYARALRGFGSPVRRIYFRHILPNIAGALIVNMTINFPDTILAESSLSFLGLGIQPPLTSLGSLLGYGRDYLLDAWWIAVIPGLMIFFTTLAMSLLGDWVRDKLDPALKKRA
jgi:peptide/nickel transport system permease protein